MEFAVGVFQHQKSEGYEEFLTAMDTPWVVKWENGWAWFETIVQETPAKHKPIRGVQEERWRVHNHN